MMHDAIHPACERCGVDLGDSIYWLCENCDKKDQVMDRRDGDPAHYRLPVEPIDYIVANGLPFCEGNVIKYVSRHGAKGGAEDIKKAIRYCQFILEHDYEVTSDVTYHDPN